jgi:hypothetical protein
MPWTRLFGSPSWPVKSYTTTDQNGTAVEVNVTQPGQPLYPGVVMRYATTSPSGSTIQNEGTGLNFWQGPRSPFPQGGLDFANGFVWGDQSNEIMNGLRRRRPDGRGQPPE